MWLVPKRVLLGALCALSAATAGVGEARGDVTPVAALPSQEEALVEYAAVLFGDEILRSTGRRIVGQSLAGGRPRTRLAIPAGAEVAALEASGDLAAVLIQMPAERPTEDVPYSSSELFVARRGGAFTRVRSTGAAPVLRDVDVDGPRLVIGESATGLGDIAYTVIEADGGSAPVAVPAGAQLHAVAGDLAVSAVHGDMDVGPDTLIVHDRRTGAEHYRTATGLAKAGEVALAADGRIAVTLDDGADLALASPAAPGLRTVIDSGSLHQTALEDVAFAGAAAVVREVDSLSGARDQVLRVGSDGRVRRVGPPSPVIAGLGADPATGRLAWSARSCLVTATVADGPTRALPAGPCARAEADIESANAEVVSVPRRGRTLRVAVACVAAPPGGCRGSLRAGTGPAVTVAVPPGARRSVPVRITRGVAERARRHRVLEYRLELRQARGSTVVRGSSPVA